MTTDRQARRSRFQPGQGAFNCRCCGRHTRDTGDNGQLELCPQCFELAGYENQWRDSGHKLDESDCQTVRQYLAELASHVGNPTAYKCFPELAAYVYPDKTPEETEAHAKETNEKLEAQPDTDEPDTGELYFYIVTINGPDGYEYEVPCEASASRFARRIARSMAKEAGLNVDKLTFSAKRH